MLARTFKTLRNEAGNLLITTLVGAIVQLIVVGAIASGIVGIMLFHKAASDRSEETGQVALTDSAFRNAVRWDLKNHRHRLEESLHDGSWPGRSVQGIHLVDHHGRRGDNR